VKELYAKADWKGTAKSCEKILSFRPDNIDAAAYLEDARARINEPIQREMKIAKLKFERNEYLDAIKSFQKVKEMDPENKEAAQYVAHAIAALEKQAIVQAAVSDHGRPVFEIERNVEKSRSLYSQGLVLYSQGKLKEAASVWEQAVRFDDANALARNAYSRAQVELNEKN
jgi:tetratricopeptide (TPR) repeat protein